MKTLAKRFRTVESKQNSRLKELRRALSHSGRQERGPIGIEGPNLLKEALRAGSAHLLAFSLRKARSICWKE